MCTLHTHPPFLVWFVYWYKEELLKVLEDPLSLWSGNPLVLRTILEAHGTGPGSGRIFSGGAGAEILTCRRVDDPDATGETPEQGVLRTQLAVLTG